MNLLTQGAQLDDDDDFIQHISLSRSLFIYTVYWKQRGASITNLKRLINDDKSRFFVSNHNTIQKVTMESNSLKTRNHFES